MISPAACAHILWAATEFLESGASDEEDLKKARWALATAIYAADGVGFPPPREPTATQRNSSAWTAAVVAATATATAAAGSEPGLLGPYWVLWTPAPFATGEQPEKPAESPRLPISWAYSAQSVLDAATFGPFKDRRGGPDVALFCYRKIDLQAALMQGDDTDPGLYPRGWLRPPAAARTGNARTRATVLAVTGVALAMYTLLSVYVAAEFAKGAARDASEAMAAKQIACVIATDQDGKLKWKDDANAARCDQEWLIAWRKQGPAVTGATAGAQQDAPSTEAPWWAKTKLWFWRPINQEQKLSLLVPFATSGLAILLLIAAAGLMARADYMGAFIDGRNRLSLARLQQLGWTLVIFGGYVVLAFFNAALGAPTDSEQAVFPTMDATLWAVLGITTFASPYFSALILKRKEGLPGGDSGGNRVGEVTPIVPLDPLATHPNAAKWNWSDLFMGESEANKDTIDISRLQHLIITFMLMASYCILLIEVVRSIGGRQIVNAVTSGAPVFANMPAVTGDFIGLLILSHGGYLAFKAMSKEGKEGTGGVSGAGPAK